VDGQRAFDVAPVGLVPLAWAFTLAATLGRLPDDGLLVGLSVMAVLFIAFAVNPELSGPVLGAWRLVILAGLVPTLAGIGDVLVGLDPPLLSLAAYAWLVLPVAGLVATARALPTARRRYLAFALVSALGAGLVLVAPLRGGRTAVVAGIGLAGVGQAASVADALARNRRTGADRDAAEG